MLTWNDEHCYVTKMETSQQKICWWWSLTVTCFLRVTPTHISAGHSNYSLSSISFFLHIIRASSWCATSVSIISVYFKWHSELIKASSGDQLFDIRGTTYNNKFKSNNWPFQLVKGFHSSYLTSSLGEHGHFFFRRLLLTKFPVCSRRVLAWPSIVFASTFMLVFSEWIMSLVS